MSQLYFTLTTMTAFKWKKTWFVW